jgi:hypothetical protein
MTPQRVTRGTLQLQRREELITMGSANFKVFLRAIIKEKNELTSLN